MSFTGERTFGEMIAATRKNQGKSQETLAQEAGITRVYLSMIERGKATNLTVDTLVNLADALGVSASDLLSNLAPAQQQGG